MIARRLILTVFCSLAGVLAFACSVAFAQALVLTGQFPSSMDGLSRPVSLTVDGATGNVYVIDEAELGSLDRFDGRGDQVPFTAAAGYVNGYRLGSPAEYFFSFSGPESNEVAVDDSSGPFSGDVYLTVPGAGRVEVFSNSGLYLGALTGLGTPQTSFGQPCGVAVDSAGRVYVGDRSGFVERYTPLSSSTPVSVSDGDYTVSELSGVSEPCAVAVDGAGNVFASSGSGALNEFAASQFPASGSAVGTGRLIAENSVAVAVDPVSGHVYVDEGSQIGVYETAGAAPLLLESFGVGVLSGRSYGVAVRDNGGTPTVYVSDLGAHNPYSGENAPVAVYVFGVPAPVAPVIVGESVVSAKAQSAEVEAQVDPEFADTTYHFEYDTRPYGEGEAHGTSVPLTEGDIGAAGGPLGVQAVTPARLTGLTPGTTYHYRVVAKNAKGTTFGPDATFTTQPAVSNSTLLDGRAYELVSPPEKEGAILLAIDGVPSLSEGGVIQAEPEGNSFVYMSDTAFDKPVSSAESNQYLAVRSAGDWSNRNVMPPELSGNSTGAGQGGPFRAFSADLSSGLVWISEPQGPNTERPTLDPSAPKGYENYVLASGFKAPPPDGFHAALVGAMSEPAEGFKIFFEGANPQLTHVALSTVAALTPEAVKGTYGENLYEWTPGNPAGSQFQLVNVLPEGEEATPGASLGGASERPGVNPMSEDGSRVYFTEAGHLYLREFGKPTVRVDANQGGIGPQPGKGLGRFQIAGNNGERGFFLSGGHLTSNAGRAEDNELYMFDAASHKLTDLTPEGYVQGVVGASADGSYVYFVANGALAPGVSPGTCNNSGHELWRRCNLYVWHEGEPVRFITALSGADETSGFFGNADRWSFESSDWSNIVAVRTERVTPDGQHLVFMSALGLTGNDTRNAETAQPEQQVYIYSAGSHALKCVSCNPSGARPTGPSGIPGATDYSKGSGFYQSRVVSDENGRARVFFNSANALVAQDTNGQQDVYEWEEEGRGGCTKQEGCLGLISSGTSSEESLFLDASATGNDVFFLTQSQLVGADTDNLADVYDARAPHVPGEAVGSPAAVAVPPPCSNGDACKPPPSTQPAIYGAPASATFSGSAGPVVPQAPKSHVKGKSKKHRHGHKRQRGKGKGRMRGRKAGKSSSSQTGS